MGWLTGKEVALQVATGAIQITPYAPQQLNPNSYDYRLAPFLDLVEANQGYASGAGGGDGGDALAYLDPALPLRTTRLSIPPQGLILDPSQAYLGQSIEHFSSALYGALTTGKSSVGRLFLKNNLVQLGLRPAGEAGPLTLRISAKLPVRIFPSMRIGQIFWFEMADVPALSQLVVDGASG